MTPAPQSPAISAPRSVDSLWRALTHFDRSRIHLAMALRNAIGIAVPLAIAVHFGHPNYGISAAIGALNVAAADGLDSYGRRAIRMLIASLVVAIAVFIGATAAPSPTALILFTFAWAVAAGLFVALGQTAADIATVSLVIIIIYSAQMLSPGAAALAGLSAFLGGLLQTILSVAPWPFRRLQPQQHLIGDYYIALADAATAPPNSAGALLASQQSLEARQALSPGLGDQKAEAQRHARLLDQADRIRLSLFALRRALVRLNREEEMARLNQRGLVNQDPEVGENLAAIPPFLDVAADLLRAIGTSLHNQPLAASVPQHLLDLTTAALALRQFQPQAGPAAQTQIAEAQLQMDALASQLSTALQLAGFPSDVPSRPGEVLPIDARPFWILPIRQSLATLRANLSLDSSACRHGIRLALCIAAGELITRGLPYPRSYWTAMTIALVLKPDFGNTFTRGALRLAGTYLGLILATVLFHFIAPSPPASVLFIVLLAFVQFSLGRANYGILVTAVSGLVVFLFTLSGIAPAEVITTRAIHTTIGGTLALVIYFLWPTRERTQTLPAIAQMLDAHRAHFRAVARCYIEGKSSKQDLHSLRGKALLSRSNVETSIDRWSAEPFTPPGQIQIAQGILGSSHRFLQAITAMEAAQSAELVPDARAAFEAFSNDAEKLLYFLAAHLNGSAVSQGTIPNLRADQAAFASSAADPLLIIETDRIATGLELLAEQIFNWAVAAQNRAR